MPGIGAKGVCGEVTSAAQGQGAGVGHDQVEALLALGQATAGAWGELVSPDAAERAMRMHRNRLRRVSIKFFDPRKTRSRKGSHPAEPPALLAGHLNQVVVDVVSAGTLAAIGYAVKKFTERIPRERARARIEGAAGAAADNEQQLEDPE